MTIPPLQTKNDVCDDAGMVCSLTSFHYSTAVVVVVAVDVAELLVGCDGDDDVAFDVVAAVVVVVVSDVVVVVVAKPELNLLEDVNESLNQA